MYEDFCNWQSSLAPIPYFFILYRMNTGLLKTYHCKVREGWGLRRSGWSWERRPGWRGTPSFSAARPPLPNQPTAARADRWSYFEGINFNKEWYWCKKGNTQEHLAILQSEASHDGHLISRGIRQMSRPISFRYVENISGLFPTFNWRWTGNLGLLDLVPNLQFEIKINVHFKLQRNAPCEGHFDLPQS